MPRKMSTEITRGTREPLSFALAMPHRGAADAVVMPGVEMNDGKGSQRNANECSHHKEEDCHGTSLAAALVGLVPLSGIKLPGGGSSVSDDGIRLEGTSLALANRLFGGTFGREAVAQASTYQRSTGTAREY